jgi:hypothetical protein
MGSFTQRLTRLEKAAPDCWARCRECGGPDPNGRRIAYVSDARPLRRCDDCGNPIDGDGKPLGEWRNGSLRLKVIAFVAS